MMHQLSGLEMIWLICNEDKLKEIPLSYLRRKLMKKPILEQKV